MVRLGSTVFQSLRRLWNLTVEFCSPSNDHLKHGQDKTVSSSPVKRHVPDDVMKDYSSLAVAKTQKRMFAYPAKRQSGEDDSSSDEDKTSKNI